MIVGPPVRSAGIPEGAMIDGEITVTSYIVDGGAMMYCTHVNGEMNLAQAVGLMDLGKYAIKEWYLAEREDDDDD